MTSLITLSMKTWKKANLFSSHTPSSKVLLIVDHLENPRHKRIIDLLTIITPTLSDLQQLSRQMKVFTKVILATQQHVCTLPWHMTQYLASLYTLITRPNPHFWNTRVGFGRMVNDKLSFGSSYLFIFEMRSKATHT